jgi:hypothetical protein
MGARREVVSVVMERYRSAKRAEKSVTGLPLRTNTVLNRGLSPVRKTNDGVRAQPERFGGLGAGDR